MSFKFVNGSGQTCKLENIGGLPSGIGTSVSPTIFCWLRKASSKYFTCAVIGSDPGDSGFLDYHWLYQESAGNFLHSYVLPYGGAGSDALSGTGFSADTWIPVCSVATLGGNSILQINGGSDVTAGTLSAAWHGGNDSYFDRIRLGQNKTNEGQDSDQTAYLAHVLIVKRALNSTERGNLAAGDNPRAIVADADIIEYWDGSSFTGYKGTVLSTGGTGTVTANDAENPTVDDPPGGGSTDAGGMLLSSRRNRLTIP